jgi:L-aminopeptidase/D-esterase-like protein
VGKLLGRQQGCKSGLGSFSAPTGDTLQVAALAVVNAFGDVRDPDTGRLVAGARETITSHRLADSGKLIRRGVASEALERARGESTTLGLVATNARLAPLEAQKVAKMASAAFHSTISPSATMVDGDLCFCLSTGGVTAELHRVGLWARFALERAILQAVLTARSAAGLPAARDL